jgi:hypothetical protein
MYRKLWMLVLLVVGVTLLAGCGRRQAEDERLITAEYERIALLLPSTFDDDVTLPEGDEEFEVTYRIDGVDLDHGILYYEESSSDHLITLEIILRYRRTTREFEVTILRERVSDPLDPTDLAFADVEEGLRSLLPERFVAHTILPREWNGLTLPLTHTCGEEERGYLLYPFPEDPMECYLSYEVTINETTRTIVLPMTIASVQQLPRVPRLYINTEDDQPVDSKENTVAATMTVVTYDDIPYPDLTDEPLTIRLRGNSTLYMPKKSYKVKFDDQVRLLSHHAERDWVLLANFADQTLIRNALAFSFADRLRMRFVPSITFVDVYLNGEYQGNYLLTDQIEVTGDRVDIEENVSAIDTGYLLEYDYTQYLNGLGTTGDNFFLIDGIPFVIHSPDHTDDHYRPEHFTFIEDYMNDVVDTLKRKDDYSHLIDEASFIDWFLVNEVFKNVDSGYSSVYYYKMKSGKLYMGPVWDFDLSTGNPGHLQEDLRGPDGWYTSRSDKNLLFHHLMQYPSFQQALKARWNEVYDSAILPILPEIWEMAGSINHSRYHNFLKWDVIGSNNDWYTAPEILALSTYDEQVWFLYDYLAERIAWLNNAINDF